MKKHTSHTLIALIAVIGFSVNPSHAATLSSGYTIGSGSQLLVANGGAGTTLFVDSAAGGGSDVTGTGASFYSVLLDGSGFWNIGDTVSITGLAMPLVDAATLSGTFTFDIRKGAGGTGTAGVGSLSSIATVAATYTQGSGIAGGYYVNFDSPVTFVADSNSTSIVINWTSTAQMRWKKELAPGAGRLSQVNYGNGNYVDNAPSGIDSVRFSVAGSVTPVPEPSSALLGALCALGLLRRRR